MVNNLSEQPKNFVKPESGYNQPPKPESVAGYNFENDRREQNLNRTNLNPASNPVVNTKTNDQIVNQVTNAQSNSAPAQIVNDDSASDNDMIENVWIEKSRSILEDKNKKPADKHDEYQQISSDYKEKRYGSN